LQKIVVLSTINKSQNLDQLRSFL